MVHTKALIIKDVYKTFRLPHEHSSGIKQMILNLFRHPNRRINGYEVQSVLNDISFEIEQGEFFGIVGRNGSGKSTLLKTIAGIYAPDRGLVQVNGSLTPFIELGVGFNPELTGRENVYLNGALLGFSHDEMDAIYEDIVSFAELGRFMDQKLKNYSSGMQVRLAFSIAIRAKSDILLIDEVLAVGDQAFQKKCFEYFRELRRENRTVILVTHDMEAVKNYCTKAMLINKSRISSIGTPSDIADEYQLLMSNSSKKTDDGSMVIRNIAAEDFNGDKKVSKDGKIDIKLSYTCDYSKPYFIAYSIKRDGIPISDSSSQYQAGIKLGAGEQNIRLQIDASLFTSAEYSLDIAFYDANSGDMIAFKNGVFSQLLSNSSQQYGGYFIAPSTWSRV